MNDSKCLVYKLGRTQRTRSSVGLGRTTSFQNEEHASRSRSSNDGNPEKIRYIPSSELGLKCIMNFRFTHLAHVIVDATSRHLVHGVT